MTISSTRRPSRRSENSQQLIVFRILHEWFALPIRIAYKVIPIGQIYGTCPEGGVGLTRYKDRDVLVIDIQRRIFGERASQPLLPHAETSAGNREENNAGNHFSYQTQLPYQRHLLLIYNPQGELIGLPLDTPPKLRRVAESAFAPVPPIYTAQGGIRCISAVLSLSDDEPLIFLLNPSQLLQTQTALPSQSVD